LVERSGVEIGRVVVVHDDLDLPLGCLRIRVRGGHGGHNGVRSVIESLGSGEFVRLKLGIGRPAEGESVVDHVLSPFRSQEEAVLSGFLDRAAAVAESIIVEGPARAMNRFHT
ncbi:MAG: aminoacyl-tRNA hydrolase, partial [Proteobacteria bacterium]|nr:aminoacyl-tRNA hydrolase [Pseudomonadota bacterium]